MRKVGVEMHKAQNYVSAIQQLTSVLEIASADKKSLMLRADAYEKNQQHKLSIDDYVQLFKLYPSEEEFAYKAAEISFKINEYSNAIQFSNRVIERNKKNNKVRVILVDSYMALNDFENARPHAKHLLDEEKGEVNYYKLGVIDYHLANYKSAEVYLRQTLNLNTKNVNAMLWLARTLDKMEKYRLATAQCIETIKIDPRNVEIYKVKSLINEHTLNFREAVDDLSRVLAIEPENTNAYSIRAMLYLKINERAKAIDDYKSVIKYNPKDYETYIKIVDLLLEDKDTKSALSILNQIKDVFSNDPEYKAKLHFIDKQIIELNPDNTQPEIIVSSHKLVDNKIELKKQEETIVFYITDQSDIKSVIINGVSFQPVKVNDKYKVIYVANSGVNSTILIQVADVHGNVAHREMKLECDMPDAEPSFASISGNFTFKPYADVDFDIPNSDYIDKYTYALIIGNEDYTSNQTGLNTEVNVAYAQNDAYVFKQYAASILGVPDRNIMFYTNATSGVMSQAIAKFLLLMEKTAGKGTFYFYYAGHGLPDEETKEPYLIPSDMNGRSLKGAVSLIDLYHKIKSIKAQKITFFIDACFSGGARNTPLLAARGVKIRPKEPDLKGPLFVFTASSEDQSALPYEKMKHGMFTYFILKKLKETAGNVTYKELTQYVQEQVDIESLMTNDKEQTPFIGVSPTIAKTWEEWKFIKN